MLLVSVMGCYGLRDATGAEYAASAGVDLGEASEGPEDVVAALANADELAKAESSADKEVELQPEYSDDEVKQIATAQVTDIPKAFNGSFENIKKAGKVEDMVVEYRQATKDLAAMKDVNRVVGNKASKDFSLTNNKVLHDREEQIYTTRDNTTRSNINITKEKYIEEAAAVKMAHAVDCKKLMANNPYPPDSRQFKQVVKSCEGEDERNLDSARVVPAGSHDPIYGPYEDRESLMSAGDMTANGDASSSTADDDTTGGDDISSGDSLS